MKNLKLFIWEGVLSDYTDGIAFALAETEERARKLCLEQRESLIDDYNFMNMSPKVYDHEAGFTLYGGG